MFIILNVIYVDHLVTPCTQTVLAMMLTEQLPDMDRVIFFKSTKSLLNPKSNLLPFHFLLDNDVPRLEKAYIKQSKIRNTPVILFVGVPFVPTNLRSIMAL